MRGIEDLEDVIARHVERYLASRYHERHALVTSYDPDKYLAKVMYQPEGFESGWLPIETGHIGDGYGIAVGLTTGDGKSTGDQVKVGFQEGDIESGKIVQRLHSDKDKPPRVESGEMVFWTTQKDQQGNKKSQMRTFYTKDGQIKKEILDSQGNVKTSTVWDANSITHNTSNYTEKAGNQISMQGKDIETVGRTWLGLNTSGERSMPRVVGTAGPKSRVWGKIG